MSSNNSSSDNKFNHGSISQSFRWDMCTLSAHSGRKSVTDMMSLLLLLFPLAKMHVRNPFCSTSETEYLRLVSVIYWVASYVFCRLVMGLSLSFYTLHREVFYRQCFVGRGVVYYRAKIHVPVNRWWNGTLVIVYKLVVRIFLFDMDSNVNIIV